VRPAGGRGAVAPGTRPAVPAPVALATAVAFGLLTGLRGRRIFHPDGTAFTATLAVDGAAAPLPAGRHLAIARFSRGLGLPQPLPDVLGVALRVRDVWGRGGDQDLLMVTSGGAPLLRHAFLPAASFFARPYSSVLFFRTSAGVVLFGLLPATAPIARQGTDLDELRAVVRRVREPFALAVAGAFGPWRPFARLSLETELAAEYATALSFDPWNGGDAVRPVGPFNALRDPAYRASQVARRPVSTARSRRAAS
jgi:hypothetical protein